jgi:hypothetical protein
MSAAPTTRGTVKKTGLSVHELNDTVCQSWELNPKAAKPVLIETVGFESGGVMSSGDALEKSVLIDAVGIESEGLKSSRDAQAKSVLIDAVGIESGGLKSSGDALKKAVLIDAVGGEKVAGRPQEQVGSEQRGSVKRVMLTADIYNRGSEAERREKEEFVERMNANFSGGRRKFDWLGKVNRESEGEKKRKRSVSESPSPPPCYASDGTAITSLRESEKARMKVKRWKLGGELKRRDAEQSVDLLGVGVGGVDLGGDLEMDVGVVLENGLEGGMPMDCAESTLAHEVETTFGDRQQLGSILRKSTGVVHCEFAEAEPKGQGGKPDLDAQRGEDSAGVVSSGQADAAGAAEGTVNAVGLDIGGEFGVEIGVDIVKDGVCYVNGDVVEVVNGDGVEIFDGEGGIPDCVLPTLPETETSLEYSEKEKKERMSGEERERGERESGCEGRCC